MIQCVPHWIPVVFNALVYISLGKPERDFNTNTRQMEERISSGIGSERDGFRKKAHEFLLSLRSFLFTFFFAVSSCAASEHEYSSIAMAKVPRADLLYSRMHARR